MAIKQDPRLLNLKGPLADNDLVLTAFTGEEELSRLFRFELEMVSDNADIKPQDVVGKNVTFSVRLADDSMRHFNGFVSRFFAGDENDTGRRSYRAEVVPSFWFLTRHSDCRIFEDQDLKQIIEKIFGDRGLNDFEIKFKGHHPKREYCVQYRETDFNFLSRLLEEEGAWYTFVHEDGKHTMLIGDKASAYVDCSQAEVDYPTDIGSEAMEDHIRSWEHRFEFRSGKVAHSDFNFVTPSQDLGADSKTVVDLSGPDKYELYDYPGYYFEKGDGQPLADVRMEEEEVEHDTIDGTSICRAFSPGAKFKIRQHRAKSEENKKYVLTLVHHVAHETMGYETGAASGEGYTNRFRCIPDKVNFRPAANDQETERAGCTDRDRDRRRRNSDRRVRPRQGPLSLGPGRHGNLLVPRLATLGQRRVGRDAHPPQGRRGPRRFRRRRSRPPDHHGPRLQRRTQGAVTPARRKDQEHHPRLRRQPDDLGRASRANSTSASSRPAATSSR